MDIKRHIGRLINTDRRCIVVYTTLPGREDHALIVDTDALPDRLHDALMDVVESKEAQSEVVLGNVLSRRILPDLGIDLLNALHSKGCLLPMPINGIMMYPLPNQAVPLRQIVEMSKNPGLVKEEVEANNYESLVADHENGRQENNINVARNMLLDAELLENDARIKREQAYKLAPSLRPRKTVEKTTSTPTVLSTDEKLELHLKRLEETTETTEKFVEGVAKPARRANGTGRRSRRKTGTG